MQCFVYIEAKNCTTLATNAETTGHAINVQLAQFNTVGMYTALFATPTPTPCMLFSVLFVR